MELKIRELRELLFYLENQDMTIREFRSMLFAEKNDKNLALVDTMWKEIENKYRTLI